MVNTRAKFKKNQNIRKICFKEASTAGSDHQSTDSGASIGASDDLLTEILRRLPVTSVLRFKSVSKHWLSLLSHRCFTLLYNGAATSPGFFLRNYYIPFDDEKPSTPPFRDLDFYPDLSGIKIVQSCNGLLLCCSDRGSERDRRYYVFNPTTKQFRIIPSVLGGRDVRQNVRFMCLAYHQTDCVHYKVVCIHSAKPYEDLCRIQFYSSDIGKWMISDQSFSASYRSSFSNGVYWNGAIHWAPSRHNPLYFKLDEGQLRTLPLPMSRPSSKVYYHRPMPLYFGESRGHLHLVERADGGSQLHLTVYEMSSDHSGWFVKYQVELDELPRAYPGMINSYRHPLSDKYYNFKVFDIIRDENEEETFMYMVVRIPFMVIGYNMADKSFKNISDLSHIHEAIKPADIHRYIESLASF